jgi:hypothetical protein
MSFLLCSAVRYFGTLCKYPPYHIVSVDYVPSERFQVFHVLFVRQVNDHCYLSLKRVGPG